MKVTPTDLPEVLLIEPRVFGDARGFFFESYHQARFDEAVGRAVPFAQDNHSRSVRGVLRGLHFQLGAQAQGKLVRAAVGSVFDVAVDLRRSSPSFGRWVGVELSAENHRQLWIPEGFGHGFLTLSPVAELLYKATTPYAPEAEGSVRWDDPELAIAWPALDGPPLLSAKDAAAPRLAEARLFD